MEAKDTRSLKQKFDDLLARRMRRAKQNEVSLAAAKRAAKHVDPAVRFEDNGPVYIWFAFSDGSGEDIQR